MEVKVEKKVGNHCCTLSYLHHLSLQKIRRQHSVNNGVARYSTQTQIMCLHDCLGVSCVETINQSGTKIRDGKVASICV